MSTPSGDFTPDKDDPLADSPPPDPAQMEDIPPPPAPPGSAPGGDGRFPDPYTAPQQPAPPAGQQPGEPQQYRDQQHGNPPPYSQGQPGAAPGAHPYPPRPYYPKTWMNIVALITGLMCFGPIAVIFGHLGVNAANRGEAEYKGMGTAGLILGYAGLAFYVLYFGFLLVAVSSGI